MSKFFYNSLQSYKSLKRASFHTPGHKGEAFKNEKFYTLDYTELPLTDSLYDCDGIIKQAEQDLSKLYGSKRSIFSSGGNTLCIQTMFRLCAHGGGKVICDRVCHRSAVSAMALLGIEPIWINRKLNPQSGLLDFLDLKDIEDKLSTEKDVRAVYITSPDYYGIMQDIKSISAVCLKYNVPLIVDNAHGSHLKFVGDKLHPLDCGAAMSADSAHKTLPVLTGGAWLHINDEKFCKNAKKAMALFGSTSPSYPVMASMDLCREWLSSWGRPRFEDLKTTVCKIRELAKKSGIYIPDEENSDPCRITLGVWNIGLTGFEAREHFYKFKIEPEFCDANYVVLIPSPYNLKSDWSRLKLALRKFKEIKKPLPARKDIQIFRNPDKGMSLREAVMSDYEVVSVDESLGRISVETASLCPPGVPVIIPGEKIGKEEQDIIRESGITRISVVK